MNTIKLFFGIFIFITLHSKGMCKEGIEVKVIEPKTEKKSTYKYFFIDFSNCDANLKADSIFKLHHSYFNHNAQQDIKIITSDNDTIRPTSYLFEGNVENIRPFYRIIIGFESKLMRKKRNYRLNINTLNINQIREF